MTFYIYRLKGKKKEYFMGRSLCNTYFIAEREKARVFNYRFDAEQKVSDFRTSKIKCYIEEAN